LEVLTSHPFPYHHKGSDLRNSSSAMLFYLTTIYSFSNIGECVMCTWDPGLEEVLEFEKIKINKNKKCQNQNQRV
jgi:hypothetical protein